MVYSTRHIEGSLASAERREVQDGEETLSYELAQTLTKEHMAEGVSIDFGTDKAAFESTIRQLDIERRLGYDLKVVHASAAGDHSIGHVGIESARDVARELGLMRALELVQTRQWSVAKNDRHFNDVQFPDSVTSRLIIGAEAPPDEDGVTYIDTSHVAIQLAQWSVYQPSFFDEYGNHGSFEDILEEGIQANKPVQAMAAYVINNEGQLSMPGTSYALGVSENYETGTREPTFYSNRFVYSAGRIVRSIDPLDMHD